MTPRSRFALAATAAVAMLAVAMLAVAMLAAAMLAGCAAPTSVALDVSVWSPDVAAGPLTVTVFGPTGLLGTAKTSTGTRAPTRIDVRLPDVAEPVRIVARADSAAPPLVGWAALTPRAHAQASAAVVLDSNVADQDEDSVPDDIDDCPTIADPAQPDADGDGSGDACQGTTLLLGALHPPLVAAGATLWLEGRFASDTTVHFAGGVDAPASVRGAVRASVTVPPGAVTGYVTVTSGGVRSNARFVRIATFTPGVQPFASVATPDRAMPALPERMQSFTTEVIGDSLYVIGGYDNPAKTPLATVARARIDADGTLGRFVVEPSLQLHHARAGHVSAVVGNTLYVIGGAGAQFPPIETAAIADDGSLQPFVDTGIALPTPRSNAAGAVVGDSIYVIGGTTDFMTPLGNVDRVRIAADGGITVEPARPLLEPRRDHAAVVVGDRLFVLGGTTTQVVADVESAAISGDGSLGVFGPAVSTLSQPTAGAVAAVVGDSVYLVDGVSVGETTTVQRARIDADGDLGFFVAQPAGGLTKRVYAGGAIVGHWLYLLGGFASQIDSLDSLERASLDGSSLLDPFAVAGQRTIAPGSGGALTLVGRNVYRLGGDGGGAATRTIERARVGADDVLMPFAAAGMLPRARRDACVALGAGALFVVGGVDESGNASRSVDFAAVRDDGSLSDFTDGGMELGVARAGAACVVLRDTLYVPGGSSDGSAAGALQTSEMAPLRSVGTATFQPGPMLSRARYLAAAVAAGKSVLLVGGLDANGPIDVVDRATVDDVTADVLGAFAPSASLTAARGGAAAQPVGSALYLFGGTPATPLEQSALAPDGTPLGFASGGDLVAPRASPAAAVIGNFVYAIGGTVGGAPVTSVERARLR